MTIAKMQPEDCLVCQRINLIKNGTNKYFIKEMISGYVVLGDYQFYRGYTLLLSKIHVDELHKLDHKTRQQFLSDMAIVAESVYRAFKPKKINYELLGNTDTHLHWHIFPRYSNDPKPDVPIWVINRKIRCAEETKPNNSDLEALKQQLSIELEQLT